MPLIIIAILAFIGSAILGASMSGPSGNPLLSTPTYAPISNVCLDNQTARNGIDGDGKVPNVLKKVRKAVADDFVSGQGYVLDTCKNQGSCDPHPDEADYVLVASNVKVDPVFFPVSSGYIRVPPGQSDRQMLRHRIDKPVSNDSDTQEKIKGRAFRTFCGDWCKTCSDADTICDANGNCVCKRGARAIQLPYLGTFHCNFLFYLQDTDEKGNPQIDANGNLLQPNSVDSNLPINGSLFSLYFRKDAPIPDKIKCEATPTPQTGSGLFLDKQQAAYAQNETGFTWPPGGSEWLYRQDGEVKNTEVNPKVEKFLSNPNNPNSNVTKNPQGIPGEFEVFRNLDYPDSTEIIYLVPKGKYKEAMDLLNTPTSTPPPPPAPTATPQIPLKVIPFKEFHLLGVVQPTGRSLQLGTFTPPKAADWIKQWWRESKPVIYLYPPNDTIISVTLHPAGELVVSYPQYDEINGWENFTAHPDGTLTYQGKNYPYLYYEADLHRFPVGSSGSVVAGKDLVEYFKNTLPVLGLNERETKDFIEYWSKRLNESQPYYFIHFLSNEEIEAIEPLTLSQNPDTSIRVRAYFKPLVASISVDPQSRSTPAARSGFTLVEWGGILDN